ncbi:MAG: hypothetical protein VKK42_25965 [Lyngbya sp.]|nr:hypothetical protein [Lyngbya sp.]
MPYVRYHLTWEFSDSFDVHIENDLKVPIRSDNPDDIVYPSAPFYVRIIQFPSYYINKEMGPVIRYPRFGTIYFLQQSGSVFHSENIEFLDQEIAYHRFFPLEETANTPMTSIRRIACKLNYSGSKIRLSLLKKVFVPD